MRSLLLAALAVLSACPPASTGPTSTLPGESAGDEPSVSAAAGDDGDDACAQAGGSSTPGYCGTPCSDSAYTGAGTCAPGFRCDVSSLCIHTSIGACLTCASN
jgi:hypothetical protein